MDLPSNVLLVLFADVTPHRPGGQVTTESAWRNAMYADSLYPVKPTYPSVVVVLFSCRISGPFLLRARDFIHAGATDFVVS